MDTFTHISGDYKDKAYINTWTHSRTFLETTKTKYTLTHGHVHAHFWRLWRQSIHKHMDMLTHVSEDYEDKGYTNTFIHDLHVLWENVQKGNNSMYMAYYLLIFASI